MAGVCMVKNRIMDMHLNLPRHLPVVLSNCRVFFDFDNTLTQGDVLDDIIKRFSVNEEWLDLVITRAKGN